MSLFIKDIIECSLFSSHSWWTFHRFNSFKFVKYMLC